MRGNVIAIIVLLSLFLVQCSANLIYHLDLTDSKSLLMSDKKYRYSLTHISTGATLGEVSWTLRTYYLDRWPFYQINKTIRLNWVEDQAYSKLFLKSQTILDGQFKLQSFNIHVKEPFFSMQASGFYRASFLHIRRQEWFDTQSSAKQSSAKNKKMSVYVPNGVFSSFVLHYLINDKLRDITHSVRYPFFNLVQLKVEKEDVVFIRKEQRCFAAKQIDVQLFSVNNRDQKSNIHFVFHPVLGMIQRSDFQNNIQWNLDTASVDLQQLNHLASCEQSRGK